MKVNHVGGSAFQPPTTVKRDSCKTNSSSGQIQIKDFKYIKVNDFISTSKSSVTILVYEY